MDGEIFTLKEVASYLKVVDRTIHRLIRENNLPGFKIRNQWRFKKESIDKWISDREIKRR